jgi:hypothetical protein
MTPPPDFSARFAGALLDTSAPAPDGLKAWHGGATARRFAVYRNNVAVSLTDALQQRFPVCAQLVGEEFFRAMAGVFLRAHPPRSPILAAYGEAFPDFIDSFEPARELAYLADVARLEFALGRAYHAEDAAPLPLEAARSIPSETLAAMRIGLHPAVQLVASRHPIVSIWRAHLPDGEPRAVDLDCAQDAIVVRPALDVGVHVIPEGGRAFIASLAGGATLAEAAAAGAGASEAFDLTACLCLLLSSGAIVSIGPDCSA